ncbi:MAG: hemerythrin domain-containing protein [Nocardioides sp.]|nr:hemerythrin domain-containing protein [Nocardioides sp.]
MCEYCGCRGVPPIGELMDEHTALVDQAHFVRRDLAAGNPSSAMSRLTGLVVHLDRHVQREEDGIFRAMRTAGEFLDELNELEGEHRTLAAAIAALEPDSADFAAQVTRLLDDLDVHVEREDLGIFPVSVVTLGATGWEIVDQAHTRSPSFLHDSDDGVVHPS